MLERLAPQSFAEAAATARGPHAEVLGAGTAVRLMMDRGDHLARGLALARAPAR